jgi:hypothetical protein
MVYSWRLGIAIMIVWLWVTGVHCLYAIDLRYDKLSEQRKDFLNKTFAHDS